MSARLFKTIGGGPIETDAQFAKMLLDNYGEGAYSVIAWRKGHHGFWGFISLEIDAMGFRRMPKNVTIEEKETNEFKVQIRKLRRALATSEDPREKMELRKQLSDIEDDIGLNKEILELEGDTKRGPYPYLKQTQPVYKFHRYSQFKENEKGVVDAPHDFW